MGDLSADAVRDAVDIVQIVGQYVQWAETGREHKALCPFHQERTPSFTVSNGRYYCFGCQAGGNVFQFVQGVEGLAFRDAVRRVAELGGVDYLLGEVAQNRPVARPKRLPRPEPSPAPQKANLGEPVAIYPYVDEDGELLYEVHRHEYEQNGERKKTFKQRRPYQGGWVTGISAGHYARNGDGLWHKSADGELELPDVRRVLFGLPDVLAADVVVLTEGEKDALTVRRAGYCGTTHAGGSNGTWPAEARTWLSGKTVVLMPDQDEPGRKHAARVMADLKGLDVVRLDVPEGKDATDYADLHGVDALRSLIDYAIAEHQREKVEARGLLTPVEIIDLMGGVSVFGDASRRPRGLATGFARLDSMTLGMFAGQLIVVGARPGVGKTALAMNIAANVCRRREGPVHVFSLEMGRDELLTRLVCSEAGINSLKFRAGYLGRDERLAFQEASSEISKWELKIDGSPHMTVPKMAERIRAHGVPRLVIVDYLQLVAGAAKTQNRAQEVGGVSRGLKLLAKEFRVPFLVLAQLSRASETRPAGDGRPQLSDLRESGGIEQDADMVLLLDRPEMRKTDREDLRGVAHMYIAKQRNGPMGKLTLVFVAQHTRFDNLAMDREERE